MMRRTKIVCTLGPSSDTEEMIARLIAAGMNVARLNFSHGTPEYQRELIRKVKRVRKALNKPVAILQDLQGPKIRVGMIANGLVQLQPGQQFILTSDQVPGDQNRASVSLESLPQEVKVGHPILLADGNIELRVERVAPPDIYCRVVVGGPLSSLVILGRNCVRVRPTPTECSCWQAQKNETSTNAGRCAHGPRCSSIPGLS